MLAPHLSRLGLLALAACQPHPPPMPMPTPPITIEAGPPPNCVDLTAAPEEDLSLDALAEPVDVRSTPCPAVSEGKTQGQIELDVTIECNGLVSTAQVVTGIGHGCDELAADALRHARFRAARTADGHNARVRIRYVYDYQGSGAIEPPPEPTPAPAPREPPTDAAPPP